MQIVEKTAKVPETQTVPEIQTVRATQTSESLGTATFHQAAQAETVEVDKIEALLPTESASPMFVSTPVLETQEHMMGRRVPVRQNMTQEVAVSVGKSDVEEIAILVPQVMTQEVLVPVAVPKTFLFSTCPVH